MGSGGDEGDGGLDIAVAKGVGPMSLAGLMELNHATEELADDHYAAFDNRHHGRGRDPRPLARLREVGARKREREQPHAHTHTSLPPHP